MKIAISAHQFNLTDALRRYAQQKLVQSIAPMVEDSATYLEVTLSTQESARADDVMQCLVHLTVPGKSPIVVHKMSHDMYAAIDKAHDTLLNVVHEATHRSHDLHHIRKEAQKHRAEVARRVLTTRDDAG